MVGHPHNEIKSSQLVRYTTRVNLKIITLSDEVRQKRLHTIRFHFYKLKSTEPEEVGEWQEEARGGWDFQEAQVNFGRSDRYIHYLDCGDSFVVINSYENLSNSTL